mmetsp:Transcript_17201/g.58146  ORF Transcript_17201/g.58146 Transcript_17201/m.58146 type:complete len:243 (+) Transcript_17201:105-833(+)
MLLQFAMPAKSASILSWYAPRFNSSWSTWDCGAFSRYLGSTNFAVSLESSGAKSSTCFFSFFSSSATSTRPLRLTRTVTFSSTTEAAQPAGASVPAARISKDFAFVSAAKSSRWSSTAAATAASLQRSKKSAGLFRLYCALSARAAETQSSMTFVAASTETLRKDAGIVSFEISGYGDTIIDFNGGAGRGSRCHNSSVTKGQKGCRQRRPQSKAAQRTYDVAFFFPSSFGSVDRKRGLTTST